MECPDILEAPTSESWVAQATTSASLPVLLVDHANCERKAAASALALMNRYSHDTTLAMNLSRIAREELVHFEQVCRLMQRLGIAYRGLSAGRYARELHSLVAKSEPDRLTDLLLVAALIEARSLERFLLLATRLPPAVARFYKRLAESERRHFEFFVDSALRRRAESDVRRRLGPLRERESQLATLPDRTFRFHSGPVVVAESPFRQECALDE